MGLPVACPISLEDCAGNAIDDGFRNGAYDLSRKIPEISRVSVPKESTISVEANMKTSPKSSARLRGIAPLIDQFDGASATNYDPQSNRRRGQPPIS